MAHERSFFPSSSASLLQQQQQRNNSNNRLEENSSSFAASIHNGPGPGSLSAAAGGGPAAAGHEFLHVIDELRSSAKLKADMVSHPLFEHLLRAHVQCLSVGLPPEQVRGLEEQLANTHSVAIKYLMLSKDHDDHDHHHDHHIIHHSMAMPTSSMSGMPPNNNNNNNKLLSSPHLSRSSPKENIDEFMVSPICVKP